MVCFPIQATPRNREQGQVRAEVYRAAYEVYAHVYGEQAALLDLGRGCRGGFSTGELVAFLYARAFPREEWRTRVDEAVEGMNL